MQSMKTIRAAWRSMDQGDQMATILFGVVVLPVMLAVALIVTA